MRNKLNVGTYDYTKGEWVDYTFYDQLTCAVATLETDLFQTAAGKTLDQCNFVGNGQMPKGNAMHVFAIRCEYIAHAILAAAGVQLLLATMNNTTVQILISNKPTMWEGTLAQIVGKSIQFVDTSAATLTDINSDMGVFPGVLPLNKPIILEENTFFRVRVHHWTATAAGQAGDFIKIGLSGMLLRQLG